MQQFGEKLGKKFDLYRTEIFTVLSAATLGPGASYLTLPQGNFFTAAIVTPGNSFFVIGLVFLIGSLASSIRDKREVASVNLQNKRMRGLIEQAKIDFSRSWSEFSQQIFQALEFTNSERISFYRHDPTSDEFYLMGRYALNPHLNKRGRVSYPAHEGCIGAAWRDGEAKEGKLPNPAANMNRYCEVTEAKWGIPKEKCLELGMKPQTIWAYSLIHNGHRFAVVVAESERKKDDAFFDKLRSSFDTTFTTHVLELKERLSPVEPSIAFAREHGF